MSRELVIEVLGTLRQGVFTAAKPGLRTSVGTETLVIGRCPSRRPSLTLEDGTVSPNHAEVSRSQGIWRIKDLDSDNGLVFFPPTNATASNLTPWPRGERRADATITGPVTVAIGAVVVGLSLADP
jgi:hypothetical protein